MVNVLSSVRAVQYFAVDQQTSADNNTRSILTRLDENHCSNFRRNSMSRGRRTRRPPLEQIWQISSSGNRNWETVQEISLR